MLQDLEKKFEKYGPVKEARIVRNPRSGESRGFGFLIMENDDDVDRVRIAMSCWAVFEFLGLTCQRTVISWLYKTHVSVV